MRVDYQIDFQKGPLRYRHDHLQGRNELIAKAIGWKKDLSLKVIDATAGLGREAFLLAALGCEVTLFERNATVCALLEDAIHRAKSDITLSATLSRMHLVKSCAISALTENPQMVADVIYCDPMFEERTKSALVKKEMQLLQELVGTDEDSTQLVNICLQRAQKRLVVKRSLSAPLLLENPTMTYKARSHRFDVYLKQNLKKT